MRPLITQLEAALLGLLCEKPMHPYEIEKTIEARSMREWTEISMSSVYKTLRALERQGLVKTELRLSKANRAQKVATVTPAGREAMRQKVMALLSHLQKPLWPVDIALSNLGLLTPKEAETCLEKYIADTNKTIECYQALRGYLEEHCPLQNIQLAERPLHLLAAEAQWAGEFLQKLRQKRKVGKAGK